MKIVVSVNHPGHVHLFKNFIWNMRKKGHEVLIVATEKDVSFKLLNNYGFSYINLGSYGISLIQKIMNLLIIDLKMYKEVKNFNPDVFVGMGSISAAHVSFFLRKKCIIFEDTEHSTEQISLYLPFANTVCTPTCFKGSLGKKQIRYNGYHELAYLHPDCFTPNPEILKELGMKEDDTFIILRFISWNATHDLGHHGIQKKIEFVKELEEYGRVLITSEGKLQPEFEKYKIKVSPEKLHDLLYYATLYIGEGGTTASEAATLGTHSIHISTTAKYCGIFNDLHSCNLMWTFDDESGVIDLARGLLQRKNLWEEGKEKRNALVAEKINVTDFMVWLIENYPQTLKMTEKKQIVMGDRL